MFFSSVHFCHPRIYLKFGYYLVISKKLECNSKDFESLEHANGWSWPESSWHPFWHEFFGQNNPRY